MKWCVAALVVLVADIAFNVWIAMFIGSYALLTVLPGCAITIWLIDHALR